MAERATGRLLEAPPVAFLLKSVPVNTGVGCSSSVTAFTVASSSSEVLCSFSFCAAAGVGSLLSVGPSEAAEVSRLEPGPIRSGALARSKLGCMAIFRWLLTGTCCGTCDTTLGPAATYRGAAAT
eukprot:CAMPEP_0115141976 /NCGR_PEP_ID=MMETSP0227-20121206/59875_1 /TAXON_ID=89957 /ORGANISM="Polarella glacialis, Strain CCMP 1383" /LENGTH=124 /DNA_ID=CAMNT_0002550475 /DNA_START=562 /DNA_END=936 /DNA_ORIENTATION=+